MKRLVVALFSLVAVSSTSFADEADRHIAKGNEFVQKKDYSKALVEYEKAVKKNPSHAKANLLLGLTCANTGNLQKAIEYTNASIKIEPSFTGYNNLGLIYANNSDFAKAAAMYEKALEKNPAAFRTWYQLGLTQAAAGNFLKAVEAYQKAIGVNPQFAEAYVGLGSAHYWSGNRETALQQVTALRAIGKPEKAAMLDTWIQNKEKKKSSPDPEAIAPSSPSPAA